jgi:hypothetical protein
MERLAKKPGTNYTQFAQDVLSMQGLNATLLF